MTPDFLIEAPTEDRGGAQEVLWRREALRESVGQDVRITRQAPGAQALVAVVGLGPAAAASAVALSDAGFPIVAIETSPSRLGELRGGWLRGHLGGEGFVLSDRIEAVGAAEYVVICPPPATDAQGHPNAEALRRACAAVVEQARPGQTFLLTSTTHVGGTRELLVEPLAARGLRAGEEIFVAFSAERFDPGAPAPERLRTPRVLGAVSESCHAHAAELLGHLCDGLHRVSSCEAAEMAKLYESTFSAVNIALAFEMADACRARALDPVEVTEAAATKPSGFLAHYPSAGVGGHGAGVEPHHLLRPLRERGVPVTIAEEAMRTVAARPRRVANRAHELLLRSGRQLRDVRVLVVGIAHRPGVPDAQRAPAVEIITRLIADGVQVDFHDPLVPALQIDGEPLHSVDPDPRRDASGFGPEDYELAIVLTMHPGHDYGWLRRCPQVLDCTYRAEAGRRRFLP